MQLFSVAFVAFVAFVTLLHLFHVLHWFPRTSYNLICGHVNCEQPITSLHLTDGHVTFSANEKPRFGGQTDSQIQLQLTESAHPMDGAD